MSNYVGCSQYSIFCYVGFFLKIVEWKKKKKKAQCCCFSAEFPLKKKYWKFCVSEPERCWRSADIWERNGDLYPEKKLWAELWVSRGIFLWVFCAGLRFWGQVESPRLFPIAVGAAGLVNLYLAINVVIIPSPIGGTGSQNPRGHIKISVQIHTWRCLCSFSQELSGWALLFWEGKKKNCFFPFFFGQSTTCPEVLLVWKLGLGWGWDVNRDLHQGGHWGLGRANSWAGGGAWKWEQSSEIGWVMH